MKEWFRKDSGLAVLFLLPSFIGVSLFYLLPFAIGVFYSFMNSTVERKFVGLDNYYELITSDSFHKAAFNIFYFTVVSVPLMLVLSLGLALMLNQSVYLRKWLRTSFVLPLVVPAASVILIWKILLDWNGSLNVWLHYFGVERIDGMNTDVARYVVIAVYLWKNIGYNIILFLAGLQQVPQDYYETSWIEGAGRFRQFRSITVVYLIPTMFFVAVMSILNSFKVFRETYLIAGDYSHDSIYMLQHYMNNMFTSLDIQKLSAAATLMLGCILLIVIVLFLIERRLRKFME